MGLATGYEHAEQHHVDPTPSSTRVAPPAVAPPNRRQARPMCVNDLTEQDSRGDEILVPSAEAISRPYEPAQTARQPAQQ